MVLQSEIQFFLTITVLHILIPLSAFAKVLRLESIRNITLIILAHITVPKKETELYIIDQRK